MAKKPKPAEKPAQEEQAPRPVPSPDTQAP